VTLLDAQGLRRSYGTRTVLDGVDLTLSEGDRVGVVGLNGSGKSTLGRLLAGVEEPDAGRIVRRGGTRLAYLGQEPDFAGAATVREIALAGLGPWRDALRRHEEASAHLERGEDDASRWLAVQATAAAEIERLGGWEQAHRAEAMLERVGLGDRPDRPIASLSGGEARRADLARVLVSRADVVILDEPTNHLDIQTVEWLEGFLAQELPGALVLITHDRYFLDRVATRTVEVSAGALHFYEGGYGAYLEARALREAHAARVEANRQNLLRRELEWLRRSPSARTTKQKARVQRAEAALAEKAPTVRGQVKLSVDAARSGRVLLELESLVLARGDNTLIDGLDLSITRGERVGIVGRNGAGKSSLFAALKGELTPVSGTVKLGATAKITHLDQSRSGLDEEASVYENVAGGQSKVTVGGRTTDVRAYLDRFMFRGPAQRQPVKSLSGGERARVLLAKLLLSPTNLLLLDEPTNDLDTDTLADLEELLVEQQGTALVITHDRWFLDRVATSILAFEGDGRVVRYAGNYSDNRARIGAAPLPSRKADPQAKPEAARHDASPPTRPLTYGEQIELDGLLGRITEAETEVETLEAALADPALYEAGRVEEARAKAAALEAARSTVEALTARWEELESRA
jgi:ATP-binding cassette subfamily F protein uup